MMNLKFSELKCPACGNDLVSGTTEVGVDVNMVKKCYNHPTCTFWMIIVIPNDDYNYQMNRTLKPASKEA